MNRLLIFCCSLLLSISTGAEIYKSRDAEGRTIYSDRPQEGAEPVTLPPTNTTPATQPAEHQTEAPQTPGSDRAYQLSIAQPENDSVIANGLAPLQVSLSLKPALRGEDSIRLKLDGREVSVKASTHFTIPSLPRGSHTLQAEVVNSESQVLSTSAVHKIFVYYPGAR